MESIINIQRGSRGTIFMWRSKNITIPRSKFSTITLTLLFALVYPCPFIILSFAITTHFSNLHTQINCYILSFLMSIFCMEKEKFWLPTPDIRFCSIGIRIWHSKKEIVSVSIPGPTDWIEFHLIPLKTCHIQIDVGIILTLNFPSLHISTFK